MGLGLTEARNELVSQFRATNPDKVLSLPEGFLELASARALNDFFESMEVQLQRGRQVVVGPLYLRGETGGSSFPSRNGDP